MPYHQDSTSSTLQNDDERRLDKFISSSRVSFSDNLQRTRFREIILARLKGVRDDLETKEVLRRAVPQGGMGLSEEVASGVLARLTKFLQEPIVIESKASTAEKEIAEEEVIPPAKPSKPVLPVAADKSPLVNELDRLVNETMRLSGLTFPAQTMTNRFRFLVSARLRDIKDVLETRETLLRDPKIGGLGLKEQDAERVLSVIEKSFGEFHEKWRELEERKINEWKKKQTEDIGEKEARDKAKEAAELDEMRFKLLTRAGFRERKSEVAAPQPDLLKDLPKPSVLRTPAAPVKSHPAPLLPKASITKKPVMPAPPSPSVSSRKPSVLSPTSTPRPAAFRPKMIDVKFTPRLLSPLEELKEMKLADFRRLARDPEEIVLKIKAKIDLLEHESFAKKMQGIEAWKQSEPARLCRKISSEALNSGKHIEQVILEYESKKEPVLTVQEFHAIMELIKQLRF